MLGQHAVMASYSICSALEITKSKANLLELKNWA
jgi:hypothetical protein